MRVLFLTKIPEISHDKAWEFIPRFTLNEKYMAKIITSNQADFTGSYGSENVPITFASNSVSTTIVKGLTATLSANKTYWVDGALTYTVTIENSSGETYSKGVLADVIDTANVVFDETYAVQINGQKTSDYTYSSGSLSVNLPDVEDGATLTITFQVTQA